MTTVANIDLSHLAREMDLPVDHVQRTLELLDDGNTIPFITRFRKDQTGGLNEDQVLRIQREAGKERLLAERKQTILRSVEAQGKLGPELAAQINGARTLKWLEDVYLPYKPKKQNLASVARERGLEPLAHQIQAADPGIIDLSATAATFVSAEKGLPTEADVLQGVRYILAEQISERPDLRNRLRKIMRRSGVLTSCRVEVVEPSAREAVAASPDSSDTHPSDMPVPVEFAPETTPPETTPPETTPPETTPPETAQLEPDSAAEVSLDSTSRPESAPHASHGALDNRPAEPDAIQQAAVSCAVSTSLAEDSSAASLAMVEHASTDPVTPDRAATEPAEHEPALELAGDAGTEASSAGLSPEAAAPSAPKGAAPDRKVSRKKAAKERKRKLFEHAFKDYYQFREPLSRLPPHRVLAINRGERAKVLRVRLECNQDELQREATRVVIPDGHPHAELLGECLRDALQRLVIPSLERELRRELTEEAEEHAVKVFARNLRKLLLQPPVRGRRVLAIDPAFRSGCKFVALDEFGNLVDHGLVHIIGNDEQRTQARATLQDFIRRQQIGLITIGNGTACRETEQLISDMIASELTDLPLVYVIVNEAGASVYSTSQIGREELPECDAVMRSAVSIGRRVLDPLSELVKINPANIGVGMYQHDVKAKHLRDSLDTVVNSCVNFVGVDLNTASPSLLSYVSGLNQLTARRLYEYRLEHGPFRNREQIKDVPGVGEATFVQAAGFLKISEGDNPLDATWIHPESYAVAGRVLETLSIALDELRSPASNGVASVPIPSPTESDPEVPAAVDAAPQPESPPPRPSLADRLSQVNVVELSQSLGIGELTLRDMLAALSRPGRDPRDDFSPPPFRTGIMKLEDLKPSMELQGTVLNVVDFGAFVDIGISDSALIHISKLADRYIRDPQEVVSVGDVLRVWVLEVDRERRRVSLTAIDPAAPPRPRPTRERKPRRSKPPQRVAAPPPPAERAATPPAPAKVPSGPPAGAKRKTHPPARKPPKPVRPITAAMLSGKQPMRSFSDLLQYYEKKKQEPDEPGP